MDSELMNVSGPHYEEYYEALLQSQNAESTAEVNLAILFEELEKLRSDLQNQREFHKTKLQELEDRLTITLRERDETREQLFKLKKLIAKQISQDVNPSATRQGKIQWADNQQGGNSSSPPVIDQIRWDLTQHHNRLEFPTKEPDGCATSADQQVECSNLAEKQTLYQQQAEQQHESKLVFPEEQPDESPLLRIIEDPINDGHDVWQKHPETSKPFVLSKTIADTAGHMGYHHNQQVQTVTGLIPRIPSSMPLHLPPPPEADMQCLLRTLPEKGNLLKIVMEAGPLLKTLLISGNPLPQWDYPPHSCGMPDLPPNLCMDSTPIPFHVDEIQTHAVAPHDLYFPPSNFHPTPNLVACTRNLSDFQIPLIYQAGPSSSSANLKPTFNTISPSHPMVPKVPSTSKSYHDKATYNILR